MTGMLAAGPRFACLRALAQSPLKLLVLGGTNFLGPAIVEEAMARGHEVTLFNRGRTNPGLFPTLETLHGDRHPQSPDLRALAGTRSWDAVIDVWPSDPHMVAATARLLRDRVGHYGFISTTVAYKDLTKAGAVETDALADDLTDAAAWYEFDKAQCERVLGLIFGERQAVCRSHILAGYRNPSDAFRMWAVRLARGGEVLAPGDGSDPVQFTDVRDVAAFAVLLAETRASGAYNVAGPRRSVMPFGEFLGQLNEILGRRARLTWVAQPFLDAQGVRPFSDLAMWVPVRTSRRPGFMQVSTAKAQAAGLTFRPLEATTTDEMRWFRDTMPATYEFGVGASNKGFPAARERALLAAWHARGR
ncbi:MAG: NAD-dependent epimerase/dehydratase family protein [Gemmatimonadetes bacterium]|nr:NAD-dependent epimerase/dehydratase family protein [Gemmatimonadota bacterium]